MELIMDASQYHVVGEVGEVRIFAKGTIDVVPLYDPIFKIKLISLTPTTAAIVKILPENSYCYLASVCSRVSPMIIEPTLLDFLVEFTGERAEDIQLYTGNAGMSTENMSQGVVQTYYTHLRPGLYEERVRRHMYETTGYSSTLPPKIR